MAKVQAKMAMMATVKVIEMIAKMVELFWHIR